MHDNRLRLNLPFSDVECYLGEFLDSGAMLQQQRPWEVDVSQCLAGYHDHKREANLLLFDYL